MRTKSRRRCHLPSSKGAFLFRTNLETRNLFTRREVYCIERRGKEIDHVNKSMKLWVDFTVVGRDWSLGLFTVNQNKNDVSRVTFGGNFLNSVV